MGLHNCFQSNFKSTTMSFVGKKFPSLNVTAMDEMGDNKIINIFHEATKKPEKGFCYSGIQKISLSYVPQNCMLFKQNYQSLKKKYNCNWGIMRYRWSSFCMVKHSKR